jgi:hypothetical protein
LLEDSAIRTVSSAIKMISNFIKISNLLSSSSEIEFNPGTFSCMKKSSKSFNHLSEKAIKAMYEVIKKGRKHNLSISCQLDLFDKLVNPILLYGCEIWEN